jgi:arylsulfatase A-like enzyme
MMFTDMYADQSRTAGRSSFITGQSTVRTGLSKVGMPDAPQGLQAEDVTIATLLKQEGYATGQYRVPQFVRWSGKIKAGSVSNEIMSQLGWAPTLPAAAGNPDVKAKLLTGHEATGKTYKNHLDGDNFLPYLTGADSEAGVLHGR